MEKADRYFKKKSVLKFKMVQKLMRQNYSSVRYMRRQQGDHHVENIVLTNKRGFKKWLIFAIGDNHRYSDHNIIKPLSSEQLSVTLFQNSC